MPLWGILLSFCAAALWAASPLLVNYGIARSGCSAGDVNPVRAVAFFISSLAAALASSGGRIELVSSPAAYFCIFASVIFSYVLGDAIYFAAIREIGVGLAVPIANSYPVMVVFTSWFILGEPVTLRLLWATAAVAAGVALLRLGGARKDAGGARGVPQDGRRLLRGFSIALLAGLMWAAASPLTKAAIMFSGLDAVQITFYRSAAFLVSSAAVRFAEARFSPARRVPLLSLPPVALLCFSASAVAALCVGSIFYAACLAVLPVAAVTAITSTSPLMAALFAHFVMKERLRAVQWFGIAVIFAGALSVGI